MKNKSKMSVAFAEAIANTLWLKGLITIKERDIINEHCRIKLMQNNC